MLQPPKGRPEKHHKSRSSDTHSLQFRDSCRIIGWRAPVLAVLLQERQGSLMRQPAADMFLVHDHHRCAGGHEADDFASGSPEAQVVLLRRLPRWATVELGNS